MTDLLAGLANAQLLARVRALVERGNAVEADLLAHLGEVDVRRLYLEAGCSSMFTYCQRVLRFAEGVAYKRIQAAPARGHPEVLEAVRRGDLHLTAVGLLAPKLTKENCADLIDAARHRSAEEIKQLVADREPRPATPTFVRRIPSQPAASPPALPQAALPQAPLLPLARHPRPPNRSEPSATACNSSPTARRTRSSKSCAL